MPGTVLTRRNGGAMALAIATALIGWVLHQFAAGSGLVNLSYDLLHMLRFHEVPVSEAVIVQMDERSHEELHQPLNAPWDREMHARMLDILTKAGARAVAMDIVFSDPSPTNNAGADITLARAIKANGHVILGVDHVNSGSLERRFLPPFELLRDAEADEGSVEMTPSRDLIVRAHAPNEQLCSLSWAAAKLAGAQVTKQVEAEKFQPSADLRGSKVRAWVNYYGHPGIIPNVNYAEVISNSVPGSTFSNKVIFIGAHIITKFANDRKDEYRNPYSFWITQGSSPFIAGVEIQATMLLNLLRGDWLRRFPYAVELAVIIIIGAAAGFFLLRLRPVLALVASAIAILMIGLGCRELFVRQFVWFPFLILCTQIGLALLVSIAANSVRLYVENKLYVQSLELYLSPKLVKKFAGDRERKLLQPGAEKQTLTILFSDIANFTSMSEGMDSDELAVLMNTYFQGAVANCIHATDGTVVKYIGDAIFAFWNAPDPQPNHAARACAAALRFREQSKRPISGKVLKTRIGLHTGVANVGNFGSATRVDYTAIGESINLASRLEGLNKHLGTDVLISGVTRKEIGEKFITRCLGDFKLKGFEKRVAVYELMAPPAEDDNSRALRDDFAYALQLFQNGDFFEAERAFERLLEKFPSDGPAKFYIAQLATIRAHPPEGQWEGAVELTEK